MTTYRAPVGEYQFLAGHVLAREYASVAGEEASVETMGTVLQTLGQFASDRLAPLIESADRAGCTVTADGVKAPTGYHSVYNDFVADGWGALHTAIEDGGQGLPLPFGFACDEVLSSGSMSFALYTSLRLGVYSVLKSIGSDYLKETYLRQVGSGAWNGTMCLTEPHCGTDLSLLRTTAVQSDDGTYRLSGTKIFITGGDHDLTPNIVHLVLARIQGAPAGLAGLGLFIVPKVHVNADGSLGARNGVTCPRVEEKMGIHGSATAELLFENAQGWIVGAPGAGLPGMFNMMKLARIGTSFQAIGVAEIASQNAIAYALERIQGRDLVGGSKEPLPIAEHPNIRREIVRMRTLTSSARMLAFMTSLVNEQSLDQANPAVRKSAQVILPVLMSCSKAISSEMGVEVATAAMQTHGGHGYIKDTGIEVLLRDVQILPIYEGTNDVQALDLVLRRLDDGRHQAIDATLAWLREQVAELPEDGQHTEYVKRTLKLLSRIEDVVTALKADLQRSPFAALQCAREFLGLVGHGVMATLWLRALSTLDATDLPIDHVAKRAQGQFYFAYLLPDAELRISRLEAASDIEQALKAYPVNLNF
ncbi:MULTISPECIES: acyl-CoA dehydrogenase family protein [unclassified Pseudomonas]|uniref:acyl-CoA dehydrogenase family protein n=1 Tax=unclassified Pseudomonas TaxID=196821 RepID=UPI00244D4464|nr:MULTISPECIES: acyl-CoA dehydrogenase family protein [unclassified Pseudomonas]MDG9928180.1 acyl-CoA dehydrogenase family protein [Pseudomonas sp. GD04042]MDH0481256.1 acyl-CoA dehydrogenase family protein [Pseudomonas sp. GD04015]MDH0605163.1 acyl-CoA dehydrogenase family protein [Pseudomonas sp. GD03869]